MTPCIPCCCPECGPSDGTMSLRLSDVTCYVCEGCGTEYDLEALRQARQRAVQAYDAAIELLDHAAKLAAKLEV